jgi:proliferating cell nuclear antigen
MQAVVKAEYLKTFFDSVATLVAESRLYFGENGIKAVAVDGANVAMVIAEIPKESMEAYSIEAPKAVGVDFERVNRILKAMGNESVEMAVKDSLILRGRGMEYSIALIDPSALRKEPNEPNLNFAVKAAMGARDFRNAVLAVDKVARDVILRSDSNSLYVEGKGDTDRISIAFGAKDLLEFTPAEARSMYDLEYVKSFCKIAGAGDLLVLQFGSKYPARFSFKLCADKVRVDYILAPKIETYE